MVSVTLPRGAQPTREKSKRPYGKATPKGAVPAGGERGAPTSAMNCEALANPHEEGCPAPGAASAVMVPLPPGVGPVLVSPAPAVCPWTPAVRPAVVTWGLLPGALDHGSSVRRRAVQELTARTGAE